MPISSRDAAAFEGEIMAALQREEYNDAIDLYEEMESRMLARPAHFVGKAECLLKVRRKQEAKATLFHALDLDPDFRPAIEVLDQIFPGWKHSPKPKSAAPPPPPPPPTPNALARIQPEPVEVELVPEPPKPAPVRQPNIAAARHAAQPQGTTLTPTGINWTFVMQDLEEAQGSQKSDTEPVELPQ